eukprot:245718-Chlamydomonas_euryale.AAC.1
MQTCNWAAAGRVGRGRPRRSAGSGGEGGGATAVTAARALVSRHAYGLKGRDGNRGGKRERRRTAWSVGCCSNTQTVASTPFAAAAVSQEPA